MITARHACLSIVVMAGGAMALAQGDGAAAPATTAPTTQATTPASTPAANAATAVNADSWFVLTGDNVYVRVAPDTQLGYPFAKLSKGSIVKVVDREGGWARVAAEGPSFAGGTAFVLADSRATLSEDGSSITITRHASVLAPDILRASDPASAWKVIATINEGATLPVVNTQTVNGKQYVRIALPATAEGWVSESFIAPATADDVNAATQAATARIAASEGTTAATTNAAATTTEAGATSVAGSTGETETAAGDASAQGSAEGSAEEIDPRFQAQAPSAEKVARDTNLQMFQDLETIWCTIREQPIESEELAALVLRYEALISALETQPALLKQAETRAEQIRIRMDLQERILAIAALRAEMSRSEDDIRAVARAIEARSDFNVVGTLNASIVYDGNHLPLLYRIQNPTTGATVAYVQPAEGITADTLATMLGTLVGVKGDVAFDPSLGVNLVKPRALEALTPTPTTAAE